MKGSRENYPEVLLAEHLPCPQMTPTTMAAMTTRMRMESQKQIHFLRRALRAEVTAFSVCLRLCGGVV